MIAIIIAITIKNIPKLVKLWTIAVETKGTRALRKIIPIIPMIIALNKSPKFFNCPFLSIFFLSCNSPGKCTG